ncbi:hypothetical protein Pfo_016624 [Paulownia fortunei]|nr:hypothetical protein Pfo_016624 [Paulownia fortunei]
MILPGFNSQPNSPSTLLSSGHCSSSATFQFIQSFYQHLLFGPWSLFLIKDSLALCHFLVYLILNFVKFDTDWLSNVWNKESAK